MVIEHTVEELQQIDEWMKKIQQHPEQIRDILGSLFEKTKKVGAAFKEMTDLPFSKITESLSEFKNLLDEIGDTDLRHLADKNQAVAYDDMAKGLSTVLALTTKFDAFRHSSIAGSAAIHTMGEQFSSLKQKAEAVGGMKNLFAGLGLGSVGTVLGVAEDQVESYLAAASNIQHLSNAYVNMNLLSGQSNKIFTDSNQIIGNLTDQATEYNAFLQNSTARTGESIEKTTEFASQLGLIPNVLHTMIEDGGGAGKKVDGLTTAFTLAKGAGVDTSQVLKTMQTAYTSLGQAQGPVTTNAEKGFHMFSLMAQATKDLKIQFSDAQGYLEQVAGMFKNVGDNTDGATNVLYRFTGALQNTGLTAKSSVEIITHMVDQVSKLSMGTKSLISARSGGPGGLQGAFQVENLLRQGKVDDVAKMMEKTLRQQFGGKIYSQEEAGRSPQAAAQFMRQRTMLRSGAFGNLASDDNTATRLLEAMKQGPTATAATLKDAMKNTAEQGNKLQQAQNTTLHTINAALERSVSIQQAHFLLSANKAFGGGYEQEIKNKAQQEVENIREQSVDRSQTLGTHFKNKSFESGEETSKRERALSGNAIKGALSTAPGAFDAIKDEVIGAGKTMSEAITVSHTLLTQRKAQKDAQEKASHVISVPIKKGDGSHHTPEMKKDEAGRYTSEMLDVKLKLIEQNKNKIPADIYKMVKGGHKENVPEAMRRLSERVKISQNLQLADQDPDAFQDKMSKQVRDREFKNTSRGFLSPTTQNNLYNKDKEQEESDAMKDNSIFTSPMLGTEYMKRVSAGSMMSNAFNTNMRGAAQPNLAHQVPKATTAVNVEHKPLQVNVNVTSSDNLQTKVTTNYPNITNSSHELSNAVAQGGIGRHIR